MNLDTVELINEIMIRPEIWMTKHPGNKNKWKTLSKWEEMKNSKFSPFTGTLITCKTDGNLSKNLYASQWVWFRGLKEEY